LCKSFGSLAAVDDVSFSVNAGEIFGLLGPNGAGKTTSINMICGVLKPDSGRVVIGDKDIWLEPKAVKRSLGVVPQEIAVYEDLTARDNLNFWGSLYGLSGAELKVRVDEALTRVGLSDRAGDRVKEFSGGMKRRLNLVCGLIHEPRLLLLDEPTVGVDPQSRERIFEAIHEIARGGTTVVYTTHYMEEAERLCDRIAILDEAVQGAAHPRRHDEGPAVGDGLDGMVREPDVEAPDPAVTAFAGVGEGWRLPGLRGARESGGESAEGHQQQGEDENAAAMPGISRASLYSRSRRGGTHSRLSGRE
jgi:ABC-2 type transport system ATP-binding protein